MQNAEKDLGPRTKQFARQMIRLYVPLSRDASARQYPNLECGDVSPLWNEATCCLVGKRGRARALPIQTVPAAQALRAGTSVGANYREANRARSKAEFIAKIDDCLQEAAESACWIELLRDENFLPAARLQPLLNEANELVAIFVTISKRARGD